VSHTLARSVKATAGYEPITVIAGKVGYTNTSKFSEAFKKVKGKTPLEYRKIKI